MVISVTYTFLRELPIVVQCTFFMFLISSVRTRVRCYQQHLRRIMGTPEPPDPDSEDWKKSGRVFRVRMRC